ncbi:unnamed protein product [Cyprideis torosa]|uniref:Uncharacterized protein n=1 Tax=Cyprideis torosa TaxID=163714 RepID=A0A7R8ZLF0_9CRUS|nr:unnamed protein product [Cyprideis torosa]CAG0891657.1 unnamed protein product [Cyprideis torosa]
MPQSYQSPIRVYKYPFELVMEAYERRFPTCPMIPIFLGCDVVSEFKSPDGAEHIIERRCRINVEAPYILKKIIGMEYVLFIQRNSLNRRERTLKIEAWNESFSNRVEINELCTYSAHPENPEWTCFEQSAALDVKSFFGFENSVEKLAMKKYSENISKGKEVIEHYISVLKEEGIHHVPPWVDPGPAPIQEETEKVTEQEDEVMTKSEPEKEKRLSGTLTAPPVTFKLEAEYIQRRLGKLSPLQESRLVQLKKWVAELQKGKIPSDATLLRFLRSRDFHLEKAREFLSESLLWRKQHQIDKLVAEYEPPDVLKKYFPGAWHYEDKDGRPMFVLRVGQMDVKGLVKSIGEEGLLKLTICICEEGLRKIEEATMEHGRPISTWTLLLDLEGLTMRHLWKPGVKALLRIIEIVEANYPETMGRVLIMRAPRVFPILWTVVGTFIDEKTRLKFVFCSGVEACNKEEVGLKDYVELKWIPDFLGGECRVAAPEGTLVPKDLYMTAEELERDRGEHFPLLEETTYHSVTLARGQVHEVLLQIEEKGAVICWDFDIIKEDVAFTILRTSEAITSKEPPPSPTVLQTMNPFEVDPEFRSVVEKSWKEGKDYFVVETPVVGHDGESIQGSHIADHSGTYILQWKIFEDPMASMSSSARLFDSITSGQHKAKVMYFYEILKAADYKGSMSSLASIHSGFSQMSLNDSNHSSSAATSSGLSR